MWTAIAQSISEATNQKFSPTSRRSVGGGCINEGYAVSDGEQTFFIKLNKASQVAMFEAEALGLKQILETATIRVPKPICWGTTDQSTYIVLEWLEIIQGDSQSWQDMGRQLAAMHQWHPPKQKFGWEQNNTIGSTPQINTWADDWPEFYVQHRLGYQFRLAQRRGGHFPQQEELLKAIPELLAHQPQPSLVHGDLWSGNAACTVLGPVIFDPAVYFGDREVDVAMTELFGRFPPAFYRGYNEFPPSPGYERRKPLYNLYHVLNHFNLFGGGYGSQANSMISQILRV